VVTVTPLLLLHESSSSATTYYRFILIGRLRVPARTRSEDSRITSRRINRHD
jgi:hypothetical protein